jgi:hypothetical protein
MSRLLFAIALWMGMQAATAEAAPPGLPHAAAPAAAAVTAVAAAGVMQTSLTLPEKEAKGSPSAAKATPAPQATTDAKDPDDEQGRRPTTGAMLLAGLLLMTGIALRRWGAGQQ